MKIAGTVNEGDEVAGFKVIELPGHAPGQIGLWRECDRLAITSDCFYTLDMWGRSCAPHLPEPLYNFDTEQARASIRKLAALEPAAAWPGHAEPLTGDVARPARAGGGRRLRWAGAPAGSRQPAAPSTDYRDAEGNVLTLRGSLTAGSRRSYAEALAGAGSPAASREDAWQRAGELLFERLAVRWVIAGAPIDAPARAAGCASGWPRPQEREWVRGVLREHCAEHFPDVAGALGAPAVAQSPSSSSSRGPAGWPRGDEPRGCGVEHELEHLARLSVAPAAAGRSSSHRHHRRRLEAAAEVGDARGRADAGHGTGRDGHAPMLRHRNGRG